MRSKILDIQNRITPRLENAHRLPQRWRVPTRKDSFSNPSTEISLVTAPDEMNETPTLVADRAMHHVSEVPIMVRPNMLQHANRDKDIEVPGDISIIVFDKLNL